MKRTLMVVVASAIAALALAGGARAVGSAPAPQPVGPGPVTPQGVGDLRVGDTRTDLARDHGLTQRPGDCAPRLPDHPAVSPVFDRDRLVLLWADAPLRTPDGVGVGTPVAALSATYPAGEQLPAPDEFRFDGLLVPGSGGNAYLFLHDGTTVQKVIAGSAEHARLLFHHDVGTC
jgi:hypothetical protein